MTTRLVLRSTATTEHVANAAEGRASSETRARTVRRMAEDCIAMTCEPFGDGGMRVVPQIDTRTIEITDKKAGAPGDHRRDLGGRQHGQQRVSELRRGRESTRTTTAA